MEAASSSNLRLDERFMHKNRLQEYVQRSSLLLPAYQTINEGSSHVPRFKSSVMIDGVVFRSLASFSTRKEAEQDVAKVALQGISMKILQEGRPLIHTDTTFCKSILYEYAVKMNLEKPTYMCSQSPGLLPIFISSVSFAGNMYKGVVGRTKKEAQQLAARAAIESILGDCNPSIWSLMCQIIKSKGKLYAAINHMNDSKSSPLMHLSSEGNMGNGLQTSLVGGREVQSTSANESLLVTGQVSASPVEGMKAKYVHEVISGTVGGVNSLPCQLQGGPQAAQISTSFKAILDDSLPTFFSPVKDETCESVPTHSLYGEFVSLPTFPTVNPSGLSSGNQGMSSKSKRRHSKKGKGAHRVFKLKKSRTIKGVPTC